MGFSFYHDTQYITAHQLKPNQECEGYKTPTTSSFCSFKVVQVTESGVEVLMWGKNPQILPLDALYEVKLTEKEFTEKYFSLAKDIYKRLQNKMFLEYAGYHEMWNAWIDYDIYQLAANLQEHHLELLGYIELNSPKLSFCGTKLDIGLVVKDGEDIFWCHASRKYLDDMLENYKELFNI